MNELEFYRTVIRKAEDLSINPLLLLSGIEGLYTFRDVKLNAINYDFLDSLILTIFALRVGDKFHSLAEKNLESDSFQVKLAAIEELTELNPIQISHSNNPYLQSFAAVLNGKSPIRKYHEKALEVAAMEIKKTQLLFGNQSIGVITLAICKDDNTNELGLASLFRA